MFEVRQSVCVVGINRDAVLKAKTWISSLAPESLAIESFHVRNAGDVKDGALLVPKVILVAKHCPGRKLIDHSTSNAGQLDFLYDEVCRVRGKSFNAMLNTVLSTDEHNSFFFSPYANL
jgi:hypothetical protein